MEKYKDSFIKFFKTPIFIVPLIIVLIGSYGYLLTHSTVNMDNLSCDRYYGENELIKQQRLAAPIIEKIFNVMDFYPFFADFIAVLFLLIASVLFCTLFDFISKGKIKTIAYTIFSCFFISYPMIMEGFAFTPMGINIGVGFCCVVVSLFLFNEFYKEKSKKKFLLGGISLWFAISLYESFAAVYILGVFIIILLEILFGEEKQKLKDIVLKGLKFAIPLVLVVVLNYVVSLLILIIGNMEASIFADKKIYYIREGIITTIIELFHSIMIQFVINGLGYLPITFLVISSLISFVMGITLSIKRKDPSIFLCFLGMNFTLILLSIIQGRASHYRTCQQMQLFVAFIFMLLTVFVLQKDMKKYLKNAFLFIMFFMIFYQVKDIYKWQYINDLRYQKEKQDMILLGYELEKNYDVENKPIVFIGNYGYPDVVKKAAYIKKDSLHYKVLDYYNKNFYNGKIENIDEYKIVESSVYSYIDWGKTIFLKYGFANIENIKFFKYLGFDFKAATEKEYVDILDKVISGEIKVTNLWPKEGSIVETDEYIVVCF